MAKYSEADLEELANRLESCELTANDFHHEQHLAVTAYYVRNLGKDAALDRVRGAIQRFAAHMGASSKYSEEITRFWFDQVVQVLSQCVEMPLSEAVEMVLERLGDKRSGQELKQTSAE